MYQYQSKVRLGSVTLNVVNLEIRSTILSRSFGNGYFKSR